MRYGSIAMRAGVLALALQVSGAPVWADDEVRHQADRATEEAQVDDTHYLVETIEAAKYNPLLLDAEFFALLAEEPRRSTARYAFSGSLRYIDWYASPYARDHVRRYFPQDYDHFIRDNSIGVALVSPDNPLLALAVAGAVQGALPEYAELVGDLEYADIVLVLEELSFEPKVKTSREPKSKKYGKKYRRSGAPGERLIRADYTKIKEKVSILYHYRVIARSGETILSESVLRERATRSFTYGEDLRVISEAGVLEGEPPFYPSKKTQRRMTTDPIAAREALLAQIRGYALRRVTERINAVELPYRSHLPYVRHARRGGPAR